MDFTLSAEHELLRATVRERLLAPTPTWAELQALGWLDADLDMPDLAVVAEEIGRAVASGPWWSAMVLAAGVLDEPPAEPTTVAWAEPTRPTLRDSTTSTTVATPHGGGWRLDGTKIRVPDASSAQHLLVVADTGIFQVRAEHVRIVETSTVDRSRPYARVSMTMVPAERVATLDVVPRLRARLYALLACESVGVLQRALDIAVDHARERTQFSTPIGAFQGVAHPLADTYADLELARSLAYRAAWAVSADAPETSEAVTTAIAFAAEAATTGCERAIQVLGGVGFSWEHPIHTVYKRAQWIASVDGPASARRAELAEILLRES